MFAQPPVKTSRQRRVSAFRSGGPARQRNAAPATPMTSDLGPGHELSSDQLANFGSRLGHDFSAVRLHSSEAAAASADAIGANAYTTGDDIVFAAGRYRPGTHAGDRLLAHELAHVAQGHRGGSAGPAQAEPRARAAAETVSMGGDVPADAIGGAQDGVYCDDDDEKKKEGGAGQGAATSTAPLPTSPYLPPLTLPQLDWGKLNEPFTMRGQRMTTGDVNSILLERQRSSQVLSALGIGEGFKLGPITKDWLLEKGLAKQLEDQQARENPNAIDLMNKDWKQTHPGGWETPIIPIFSTDWFRKKR